eukprot:g25178.t1
MITIFFVIAGTSPDYLHADNDLEQSLSEKKPAANCWGRLCRHVRRWNWFWPLSIPVAAIFVFTLVLGLWRCAKGDDTDPEPQSGLVASTAGIEHVEGGDCTFLQCRQNSCDQAATPYMCVAPDGPYRECSSEQWIADVCKQSCSLSNCASTTPSQGEHSCKGLQCPRARCDPRLSYQLCATSAPYQCLSGSAAMGCSADEYGWTS